MKSTQRRLMLSVGSQHILSVREKVFCMTESVKINYESKNVLKEKTTMIYKINVMNTT